jgi:hypothetical protein
VSNKNQGLPRFCGEFLATSPHLRLSHTCASRLLSALGIAMAISLSCGTPGHATLQVSAPSTVVAGSPFSATVTAIYNGKPDTTIDGPVHFTSSDKAAILPTLYVFTPADGGSHTFTSLLLMTPGSQTMTVSDYDATPVAGSVNIVVSAPGP